jgi:hypothetical protein
MKNPSVNEGFFYKAFIEIYLEPTFLPAGLAFEVPPFLVFE